MKMIAREVEYNIGDMVYLKTDVDMHARIVTGYLVSNKGVLYRLASGDLDSFHYDFEITNNKDVLLTMKN